MISSNDGRVRTAENADAGTALSERPYVGTCGPSRSATKADEPSAVRRPSMPCDPGPHRNEFDLAEFTGHGYDKGRPWLIQVLWLLTSGCLVMRWWCPKAVRMAVLRAFGAKIGSGALVRHNVRIHWPWKLRIGDHSWIGPGVWILNLEEVSIGSHTCLSQDVLICTGSHDRRSPSFEFDNAPISIGDHVWICARATVLRGVSIGDGVTVGATSLVTRDVPPGRTVVAPLGVTL